MSKINETIADGPGWFLEVDNASAGIRLDRFISGRIPRLSRARAARLLVVDMNHPETPLRKSVSVRAGQKLWVHRPIPDQLPDGPPPKILFENDGLLVLDKPPHLAVHPSASRYLSTVTHWLKDNHLNQFHPAHRLDVETSGILVCADPSLLKTVSDSFAQRRVEKTYLAVVNGRPEVEEWCTKIPLGFDTRTGIDLKMGRGTLHAETEFKVIQTGANRSLLEAKPMTGRQHQIRVHARMSGHPLVGDKLYGPDDRLFFASKERALTEEEWTLLGHQRHGLHASRLILDLSGERYAFESPLPDDLVQLLDPLVSGSKR